MIKLEVNGKQIQLENATPLLTYIEKLGVDPRAVAVEHNGTILERAAYERITLNEGDTVEIVRMVGGGMNQPLETALARLAQGQPLLDRRFRFGSFVPRL